MQYLSASANKNVNKLGSKHLLLFKKKDLRFCHNEPYNALFFIKQRAHVKIRLCFFASGGGVCCSLCCSSSNFAAWGAVASTRVFLNFLRHISNVSKPDDLFQVVQFLVKIGVKKRGHEFYTLLRPVLWTTLLMVYSYLSWIKREKISRGTKIYVGKKFKILSSRQSARGHGF